MSSLLLLPSSSLLPSPLYSVHGAAAALPTSPTSSWSPSASPQSRMHPASSPPPVSAFALSAASSSSHSHSHSAAAAASNAVVAHVLPSPVPRSLPVTAAAAAAPASHSPYSPRPQLVAAPSTYLSAAPSPLSPPPSMLTVSGSMSSPQPGGSGSMVGPGQSLQPVTLQSGQTIVFDQNGQAFILSPITNIAPTFQPAKQQQTVHLQQYAATHFPHAPVQPFAGSQDWLHPQTVRQGGHHTVAIGSAVSAHSNTIVLTPQQPQHQHQAWYGGDMVSMAASPLSVFNQPMQSVSSTLNVPMGSGMQHSHAQPLLLTSHFASTSPPNVSSASFRGPTGSHSAGLSPVPVMPSAFQPPAKRATSANASPSLTPSLRPLSPAVASPQRSKPPSPQLSAAPASGSRTPQRKMSAASASSSSSSRPAEEVEGSDMPTALSYSQPTFARNSSDSGGEQSTSPRIDGLSSSRLLTHINKKPSHVLPFIIHRSQLPHNFDHLVNSATSSSSSTAQPSTPTHQQSSAPPSGSDMVTVNIRVMGGPALSELYFVAADISQLIHSRKSNIAKAVSVFTDDERARCSVVCPRSNNTQSTHILTVLTMAGVKRLLHSSRSTIALPLLAWLQEKVNHIVAQDTSSRSQSQPQQQRPAQAASGHKRKSDSEQQAGRERHEDVKEDEGNSDKRLKKE